MEILKKKIRQKEEKSQKILKFSKTEESKEKTLNNPLNFLGKNSNLHIEKNNSEILDSLSYNNFKGYNLRQHKAPNEAKKSESNINAIVKLVNILEGSNFSLNYITKILTYFIEFFQYLDNIRKKGGEKTIKKIAGKDGIIYYYINKIDLEQVYNFVNFNYKNYKLSTKHIILSKMRKYTQLLNDNMKDNYSNKLYFKKVKNNSDSLKIDFIENIIFHLKQNNDLENLIIFYFLYYSGLTFTEISRILPFHFKMNFSLLKIKQGKLKKVKIPKIITSNLIEFNKQRKGLSQFFFYEGYKGNETLKRVEYIKYNFLEAIKGKNIDFIFRNNLIKLFSKTRNYKILSNKYYYLFDNVQKKEEITDDNHFFQLSSSKGKESSSVEKSENDNSSSYFFLIIIKNFHLNLMNQL